MSDIISDIYFPVPKTQFEWTDKNHDGNVSKKEFRSFLAADARIKAELICNGNEQSKPNQSKNSLQFVTADSNKDNFVSKEEFRAFLIDNAVKVSGDNFVQKQEPSPFGMTDTDQDGTVSKEEFRKFLLNSIATETKNVGTTTCAEAGHTDCAIQDMPEEVCCMSEFEWKNGNKKFTYKGPTEITASADGKTLFIVNHDADEIVVFDALQNKIIRSLPVGKNPNGLVLSSDEKTIYVTSGGYNGWLQAVDLISGKVVKETETGHTPMKPVLLPNEKKIFVCNRFNGFVTEYDLPEMSPVRRIKTIREPCAAVVSKDGTKIFVANYLPNDPNNYPNNPHEPVNVAASVSIINTVSGNTEHLRLSNGSCNLTGLCLSPDGRYVYVTHILSRFYNVTDHLEHGWMNANGISIIDVTNNQVYTVLLDDPELGAANPHGITTSPDGKHIFVSVSGTDEIIILNTELLHKKLAAGESTDYSNDLSFLNGMKKRIKLNGKGIRGISVTDQKVYVAIYYDDSLRQINLSDETVTEIYLGQKRELTQERAGEMYWNDATLCLEQWQSCASCHPDGRMTGMNWDLLHDGANNPKNTKSLILSSETPPTMWLGDRRHTMQCTRTGFRFIMFMMPQREPCFCIDEYLRTIKPEPSPYLVNGCLSEQAERGKIIFETTGCSVCHPAPYFTDLKMYDVGSKDQYSDQKIFDTPTLIEVWRTAPYLHDGRYVNMKDVFRLGKHGNNNGLVDQLTEKQLDDLVEYILSL
ncbi:MAG: hypothetical protein LBP87_01885 [Planctomycetaceae bacterium]|nr:hypothetical protein [Planctomycetaceae bacterium]